MNWALVLRCALVLVLLALNSCSVVQQNRRARLADPMMQPDADRTEAHRKRKLYSSREAAAGGDGKTAGGGCGCE